MRVAALIDLIATDRDLADRIVAGQDAALERLEHKDFAGTLLRFVDGLCAMPKREHPPVAFDFWAQVTEAEEMDELRPFRPAAFQALPKALAGDARRAEARDAGEGGDAS